MPSSLGMYYQKTYEAIAGKDTHVRIWHFQWLAIYALHRHLKASLAPIRGRLLDVGCGAKPYGVYLHPSVEHIGVDVFEAPTVDVVIDGRHLPFEDNAFDAILCTQVLEHVEDVVAVRDEMLRCLKPGGVLIVSVPFIYGEHSAPGDFRRFSRYGAANLFGDELEITEMALEGGVGSTIGVLWLCWYDAQMNLYKLTRFLKPVLLPLFLLTTLVINMLGWMIDRLDRSNAFYNNLLLVGKKRVVAA